VRMQASDTLCIVIDHLVCDGTGFKDYLYLLAGLYRAHATGGRMEDVVYPELTSRGLMQVIGNLSPLRQAAILKTPERWIKPNEGMHIPLAGGDIPHLARCRIEADDLDAIHGYARDRGVTLNDMFLTAFIRKLYTYTGYHDITVPCPVDLRGYGRPGRRYGICNLVSNYFCHVRMDVEEGFDKTLAKVCRSMRFEKESDRCLKGPIELHLTLPFASIDYAEKVFTDVAGIPVTNYSNLGIIDDERLSFGAPEVSGAFIATAVKRVPYTQLSISTFKGACTLTMNVYASEDDRQLLDAFLVGVRDELLTAAHLR